MGPESELLKWGSGWGVSYTSPTDTPWEVTLGEGRTLPRDCPPVLGVGGAGRGDRGTERRGQVWECLDLSFPVYELGRDFASSVSFCNSLVFLPSHSNGETTGLFQETLVPMGVL